jgi:carboxyl-terminal processing protease
LANKNINALYNNPKKPTRLVIEDVFNDIHEIDSLWKKVKKIVESENNSTISNNSFDLEQLKFDVFQQDINRYKIRQVKNNPYLDEAIAIINDYKNFNK